MTVIGFYKYENTRTDTGVVFYVKKECGRRSGSSYGRNQY